MFDRVPAPSGGKAGMPAWPQHNQRPQDLSPELLTGIEVAACECWTKREGREGHGREWVLLQTEKVSKKKQPPSAFPQLFSQILSQEQPPAPRQGAERPPSHQLGQNRNPGGSLREHSLPPALPVPRALATIDLLPAL